MTGTLQFLELVRDKKLAGGFLRGVFHIAIGRRITDDKGTVLTEGVTWRVLAQLLKEAKFDRELVREFGIDPDGLSPKDREKFWYAAVAAAKVDGPEARKQADELAVVLRPHGLHIGPPPGPPPKPTAPQPAADPNTETPGPKAAKKKKK